MCKTNLLRAFVLLGLFATLVVPAFAQTQTEAVPVTGKTVQWPDGTVTLSVDLPAVGLTKPRFDAKRTVNTIATFPVFYKAKLSADQEMTPIKDRPAGKILGDATLIVSVVHNNTKASKDAAGPEFVVDLRFLAVGDDGDLKEVDHLRRNLDELDQLADTDTYGFEPLQASSGESDWYKILPGKVYDYAIIKDDLPAIIHSFTASSKQIAEARGLVDTGEVGKTAATNANDDPNAQMINGRVVLTAPTGFTTAPSTSRGKTTTSSKSTPGTDVQVKGYYRKDGTYVNSHTRSKPSKKP